MSVNTMSNLPLASITVSGTATQTARRKRFDQAKLAELAESISTHGVLQPIIVRSMARNYELVAGERRYLAARAAGLEEIPAVVRALSDEAVIEIQLIENLQRTDVHPMEEAEGYQQLIKVHGHAMEELHARVGKSRSYVYGRMKLLALCKAAREAFYDGEINASTALLIARIPNDKLQKEALREITMEDLSYRESAQLVHDDYMLRLKDAPFKADDAKLLPKAGPCTTCPKRTGNQPELFGDVQSADVCTDPPCFQTKVKAAAKLKLDAARKAGQTVITGAQAKKVAPYWNGAEQGVTEGWVRTSQKMYDDPKSRTASAIVGPDEPRALIECPKSGRVYELVRADAVRKAIAKVKPRGSTSVNPNAAAQKKAKLEGAFRAALYDDLRPKLGAPPMQLIAKTLYGQLDHENMKIVARLQGWEAEKNRYGGMPTFHGLAKKINALDGEMLRQFVNDCIYASELQVHAYTSSKPERLLEAAKACGVDAAAVRRRVTPKKKAKKKAGKAAKKKPSKKRTAKPAKKKAKKKRLSKIAAATAGAGA